MILLNRYDYRCGFASFDAIFSLIPAILLVIFVLNLSVFTSKTAFSHLQDQQVFDKLVSIADYTVKSGTVVRADGNQVRYPNLINDSILTEDYAKNLKTRARLNDLVISLNLPDDSRLTCVYRLVIVDPDPGNTKQTNRVSRLFVCGN